MAGIEKLLPKIGVVAAGVMLAGFVMGAFSSNTYIQQIKKGFSA